MRSKPSKLAAVLLVASLPLVMGESCEDQRAIEMNKQQPTYRLTHSVERDNINARLKLANDPNQIMWVYCLSDMGNVILGSPVRGKVSSSRKRLEPKTGSGTDGSHVVGIIGDNRYLTDELMGADGTYGESDDYVYWFTPEGQYFQWSGRYIESNAPLKLDRPIFNTRDIDYQELERAKKAETALKSGKKVNNNLEVGE